MGLSHSSVGADIVSVMKKLPDLIAVTGFSIGALLLFQLPINLHNDNLNAITSYALMGASFYYFIHQYQLPTLKYFRLPELSIPSVAGLLVVSFSSYMRINSDDAITLPLIPTVTGFIYLCTIGIGEELVSRGFAFGVLRKYGAWFSLILSSAFFGLMHLNLYLGKDWNAEYAYWHCLSAAGFGFLAGVVMIVTRSILSAIVFHAFFDWTVVFSKSETSEPINHVSHFDPLWQTIKDSFAEISIDVVIALFLLGVLWLSRIRTFPKFLQPVLLKFKLIEIE
jgi:membrane protease YdiL (CAAX protease family)